MRKESIWCNISLRDCVSVIYAGCSSCCALPVLGMPTLLCPAGSGDRSADTAGEQDRYAFDAMQGDVVLLRVTGTTPTAVLSLAAVVRPDGQLVRDAIRTDTPLPPLPTAGTYTVLLSAAPRSRAATGSYAVLLQRPKHACHATAVACGATSTGTLASPVALDTYTFAAAAAEVDNDQSGRHQRQVPARTAALRP